MRVKNSKGQTALHIAAELDLADVAALLVSVKHQISHKSVCLVCC